MTTTKKLLLFFTFVFLLWLAGTKPARAVMQTECRNPNLYRVEFTAAPTSGDYDTEMTLTSTFTWLTDNPNCLNNKLQFDLSFQSLGRRSLSNTLEEKEFKEIAPPGTLAKNQTIRYVKKIKINDLPTRTTVSGSIKSYVSYGESINFQLLIESDDVDEGFDLFDDFITQKFTLVGSGKLCAYKEKKDGSLHCLPASREQAEQNKCEEALGVTANGDPIHPNSPDSCKNLGCLPVDASQCAGPTSKEPVTGGGQPISFKFKLTNYLIGDPKDIGGVANIIGRFIFNLGIPLAVLIIIYGGFRMLTSGGSPNQYKKGLEALKYATIGLAVLLVGKGFVSLVQSILSIK